MMEQPLSDSSAIRLQSATDAGIEMAASAVIDDEQKERMANKNNNASTNDDNMVNTSTTNNKNTGDVQVKVGGFDVHVSEKQIPFVGLLLASMIELMDSVISVDASEKYWAYAVSVGGVGMGLALMGILLSWKEKLDMAIGRYLAYTVWLWSFLAACVLTFGRGPFTTTGNGYFAVWGMMAFATQSVGISFRQMQYSAYDTSSLLGLGIASVVMIIALATELVEDKTNKGNLIYSLMLAILTLIFVERLRDFSSCFRSACLSIFVVGWVVAACLLTFGGPFNMTGNGYFASWMCAISCIYSSDDIFFTAAREGIQGYFGSWLPHHDDDDDDDGDAKNFDDEEQPEVTRGASKRPVAGAAASTNRNKNNVASAASTQAPRGADNASVGGAETTSTVAPYYEDTSTDEKFQIEIDVPGIDLSDIDIDLQGTTMTVTGIRNGKDDASTRTIAKSFQVNAVNVDTDKLEAKLINGVLFVSAPKKPTGRKIQVTSP